MDKSYYIYILSSISHKLYIGITNNLVRRIFEHFESAEAAITREKQLKGWVRERKLELIQKMNPELKDLCPQII